MISSILYIPYMYILFLLSHKKMHCILQGQVTSSSVSGGTWMTPSWDLKMNGCEEERFAYLY